jgi:flagellar biosynthesis/type III secretory pathway protein FliH
MKEEMKNKIIEEWEQWRIENAGMYKANDIANFFISKIEEAYLQGFEENKEAYIKEISRREKEKIYNEAFQKGKEEGTVEHCDEPNCPECNLVAYNKGRSQILEEVEKMIEGEKKEEAKSIDVGPIDIPDIETQGYNKGLNTILSKLKEIK